MVNMEEFIKCVEALKGNINVLVGNTLDLIRENTRGVKENETNIQDIYKRLEMLSNEKSVNKTEDVETDVDGFDMNTVNLEEAKLYLYNDAIKIQTPLGSKTKYIKDLDFHTKCGKEKRVYENLKVFVQNGGTLNAGTFLLTFPTVKSVYSNMLHFNKDLRGALGTQERVFEKRVANMYVLKFKTEDRMSGSVKESRVERVFSK